MRIIPLLLPLALLACDRSPGDAAPANDTAAASPADTSPASTAARPVLVEENSDALEFSYGWSADAAAIPALDRRFRDDLAKMRDEARANAAGDRALAKQDGRAFNPHDFSRSWETAGQSRRLLSLEGSTSFFTGGAHPNHGSDSLLWDRDAGKEIGVADLFDPPTLFASLVTGPYCQALDAERLKRREGEQLEGEFAQCPNLSDLAIVPADADRDGRFEAIRFIAAPYLAGPYAEGAYDNPLPVTDRLIAAMKPEYRASFEAQSQ